METRSEEYPMLLAFLQLMTVLIDSPVPSKLGAGFRVPGFEPYLDFLRDSVFLRFASRAYKRPADKVFQTHLKQLSLLCLSLSCFECFYPLTTCFKAVTHVR